jgi:hypothetical protein
MIYKEVRHSDGLVFETCTNCLAGIGKRDNLTEQQQEGVKRFKAEHDDCKRDRHPKADTFNYDEIL